MNTITLAVAESLLGTCQFCETGNLLSAPKKDGGRYFVNPATGEPHFLSCKQHPRYVAPVVVTRKAKAPAKPKAEPKAETKPKPKGKAKPKKA